MSSDGHGCPRNRPGGHFRRFVAGDAVLAVMDVREIGSAVTFGISWPLPALGGHACPRNQLGGHFRRFVAANATLAVIGDRQPIPAGSAGHLADVS